MTQNHTFHSPTLQATFEHLVVLDNLERARSEVAASMEKLGKVLDHGEAVQGNVACDGCDNCNDCCNDLPEYLSVREYAGEFGITLGTGAALGLNDDAKRESVRQKQEVGYANDIFTFHPDVLEKVFAQLLKMMNRV